MALDLSDFVSDPDLPDPDPKTLPHPFLWRILVRPLVYRKKSAGGVIIPDQVADMKAFENITAKVLAIGDHCFMDHQTGKKWDPPVKLSVGDYVTIGKFSGQKVVRDGVYVYIINCEEITGVFPEGWSPASLAPPPVPRLDEVKQ